VSLPPVAELLRPATPGASGEVSRQVSGRESHPHKITVYRSAEEIVELERARLVLRGYRVTVDRGRLVREAIAVLLADLALDGEASVAARRLSGPAGQDPAGRP
jgi:hypothetical protein